MTIDLINPYVRYARKNERSFQSTYLVACDNRLFFVESGTAKLFADDIEYPLPKGTVFFVLSGTKYHIDTDSDTIISGCNFDFVKSPNNPTSPIPPKKISEFDGNVLERFFFTDSSLFNQSFVINNAFILSEKFDEIYTEFKNKNVLYNERCSCILKDILTLCMRLSQLGGNSKVSKKAENIISYVHEHYNEDLTNASVASCFHYHPNYINNIIKKHTGKSLHQYILSIRIYRAIDMLQSTDLSITQIAEMVGMSDIHHFSKTFKKIVGAPPTSFR